MRGDGGLGGAAAECTAAAPGHVVLSPVATSAHAGSELTAAEEVAGIVPPFTIAPDTGSPCAVSMAVVGGMVNTTPVATIVRPIIAVQEHPEPSFGDQVCSAFACMWQ